MNSYEPAHRHGRSDPREQADPAELTRGRRRHKLRRRALAAGTGIVAVVLGLIWSGVIPASAGTRTQWLSVSAGWEHTCAVRADHTMWCWGSNANGQLGVGDRTDRATPTR